MKADAKSFGIESYEHAEHSRCVGWMFISIIGDDSIRQSNAKLLTSTHLPHTHEPTNNTKSGMHSCYTHLYMHNIHIHVWHIGASTMILCDAFIA